MSFEKDIKQFLVVFAKYPFFNHFFIKIFCKIFLELKFFIEKIWKSELPCTNPPHKFLEQIPSPLCQKGKIFWGELIVIIVPGKYSDRISLGYTIIPAHKSILFLLLVVCPTCLVTLHHGGLY